MPRDSLTGSRIRERRIMAGLKQAELARKAGISASYLNLIEHNRRKIGGKILLEIAYALDVETTQLTEGAGATLIATLREAADDMPEHNAELPRVDEFAGRFPGWAHLLAASTRRIAALERTVMTLSDRMTHDPHLSDSLHDMLTTITAIKSTASILADAEEIEPEWQDRFHRNINEDSARLAEASQNLVRFLERAGDASKDVTTPNEEVDAVLDAHAHYFEALEGGSASPAQLMRQLGHDLSIAAQEALRQILERYASDVVALPQDACVSELRRIGPDPFRLSQSLGVSPSLAMRRIAALAPKADLPAVGLAMCDAAGALIYRQATDGFALPRFGAGCAMLPLFQALSRPMLPILSQMAPQGREDRVYLGYAFAEPQPDYHPNRVPLQHAHMLIVPSNTLDAARSLELVGVSCRICPRESCPGRREPSILQSGL